MRLQLFQWHNQWILKQIAIGERERKNWMSVAARTALFCCKYAGGTYL